MAEQDEHSGDVRRLSSITLALTAGGHKAEAGSHCRSRSYEPNLIPSNGSAPTSVAPTPAYKATATITIIAGTTIKGKSRLR